MGKLALMGAVAGAGKGIVDNARDQINAEAARQDEQRAMRLEKLRNRNAMDRDKAQLAARADEAQKSREHQAGMQGDHEQFLLAKDAFNSDRKSDENVLDREHDVRIQHLRNKGQLDAVSQRQTAKPNAKRFRFDTVKRGEVIPGQGLVEKEFTTVTDLETAQTFEQQGTKFIPQGVDISSKPTPVEVKKAEQWVIDNPDNANMFISAYGYLPADFFKAKKEN